MSSWLPVAAALQVSLDRGLTLYLAASNPCNTCTPAERVPLAAGSQQPIPGASLSCKQEGEPTLGDSQLSQTQFSTSFAAASHPSPVPQHAEAPSQASQHPQQPGPAHDHTPCTPHTPLTSAFAAVAGHAPGLLSSAAAASEQEVGASSSRPPDVAAVQPQPELMPQHQADPVPDSIPKPHRQPPHPGHNLRPGTGVQDTGQDHVGVPKPQAADSAAAAPGPAPAEDAASARHEPSRSSPQAPQGSDPAGHGSHQPYSSHFSLTAKPASAGPGSTTTSRPQIEASPQAGRASPERHRPGTLPHTSSTSSPGEKPGEIKALRSSRGSAVGSKLKAQLSSQKAGPPQLQSQLRKAKAAAAATQGADRQPLAEKALQVCSVCPVAGNLADCRRAAGYGNSAVLRMCAMADCHQLMLQPTCWGQV